MIGILTLSCAIVLSTSNVEPEQKEVEKGTIRFVALDDQASTPQCYRLEPRTFEYELKSLYDLPGTDVHLSQLTYPTALESKIKENNTVYAEYYCPKGKGPFPGVIVLDILAGDGRVSRTIGTHLAQNGIAALYVTMPHYGPRRPPGSKVRLLSPDLEQTITSVRQTVLDLRFAAAWLEKRPEVDPKRLGILGTSLGSFFAALTGEMEPRLGRVAVLLGGGGFVDAFWDDPRGLSYRRIYEAFGGTKEFLKNKIAAVDPITSAANLKSRKLLILAGKVDEIVPPSMAEALWQASGKQKIIWYNCSHYGAVFYLLDALGHITKHFQQD